MLCRSSITPVVRSAGKSSRGETLLMLYTEGEEINGFLWFTIPRCSVVEDGVSSSEGDSSGCLTSDFSCLKDEGLGMTWLSEVDCEGCDGGRGRTVVGCGDGVRLLTVV